MPLPVQAIEIEQLQVTEYSLLTPSIVLSRDIYELIEGFLLIPTQLQIQEYDYSLYKHLSNTYMQPILPLY